MVFKLWPHYWFFHFQNFLAFVLKKPLWPDKTNFMKRIGLAFSELVPRSLEQDKHYTMKRWSKAEVYYIWKSCIQPLEKSYICHKFGKFSSTKVNFLHPERGTAMSGCLKKARHFIGLDQFLDVLWPGHKYKFIF